MHGFLCHVKLIELFITHCHIQFFERLEMFAEDSIRKHAELTERIKKEVVNHLQAYRTCP